jgi:spermidine synthase
VRKDFLDEPHDFRLVTNSFSMSGTHWRAVRYMKYYVYWPVAVAPNPKTACLISFGCGSTTKALTDTKSLESIDVVDISQEILDLASVIYTDEENPLNDPRVHVNLEDGRYFLQATDKKFDIITGDPPPPKQAGVVNLCTQEYFELIRDRLNDGGVATYWLPTMQFEEHEVKSLLRGFVNAFGDEASLWGAIGLTWVMIGTKNAEPVSAEGFAAQWNDPEIKAEMASLGFEHPGQIGATFLMDADDLREYTDGAPPLVDNWPKRMSARIGTGTNTANIARYQMVMDIDGASERFRTSPYIQKVFPPSLIEESMAYFPTQRTLNRYTLPGADPGRFEIGEIHYHLTKTDLEVPILWLLDSSPTQQAIVNRVGDTSSKAKLVAYQRGVGAMSKRKYLEAEGWFEKARRKKGDNRTIFLRAYLLCMAGEIDRAREFVGANAPAFGKPQGRAFLDWLTKSVGYSS